MAFWEELGKTITDKGKEATKKAKDLTEVIQIKSQVSAEKTKMQETYASIGKIYYDETKETQDENYVDSFTWVKEISAKLASLEEELSQLEGSRVCADCGCKVCKDDAYCRRCGAPMAQAKAEETKETKDVTIVEAVEDVVADVVADVVEDIAETTAELTETTEIKEEI